MASVTASEGPGGWVFGMPRLWAACLNVGVVLLICLMFYQDRREGLKQAREDRALFREAVLEVKDGMHAQAQAMRVLGVQVQRLTARLDRQDAGCRCDGDGCDCGRGCECKDGARCAPGCRCKGAP